MLDRDEDAALAEIEAALRRDDPEFVLMLERLDRDPLGMADTSVTVEEAELPEAPLISVQPSPFQPPPFQPPFHAVPDDDAPTSRHWWLRVGSTVLAAVLALTLTLLVTVVWGPDAGGLVGVVAIMAATMYGYQLLRGCPGRR